MILQNKEEQELWKQVVVFRGSFDSADAAIRAYRARLPDRSHWRDAAPEDIGNRNLKVRYRQRDGELWTEAPEARWIVNHIPGRWNLSNETWWTYVQVRES